jgi:predicted DNA binding CopG/RHH family protein
MNKNKQNKEIYFDNGEKKLSDYIEKNDLPILNRKQKGEMLDMLAASAKKTLAKNKTVSLRLSEKTLQKLKEKAAQEGIPYQTLIASILHKYVTNQLHS